LLRETEVFEIILPEMAEAYGGSSSSWELLFALLEGIDQRHTDGREVSTSEVLTALLLPAIQEQLCWSADGHASQPRNLDIRGIVDGVVRPISGRLRFPRKDQENCRLTVLTLFRMVPSRRMRRNSKRAILRRECLPDALWMLGILAKRFGGDFEEAQGYWERAVPGDENRRASTTHKGGAAQGRSRQRRTGGGAAAKPRRSDDRARPAAQPDDDSFFSKLPTVPEIGRVDGSGDRYGAAALSARTAADSDAAAEPAEDGGRNRGTRRKPRRRSKSRKDPARTGGATAEGADAQTESQSPAPKPRRRRRPRRRRSTSGEEADSREGDDS
jgi:hypothetical protein